MNTLKKLFCPPSAVCYGLKDANHYLHNDSMDLCPFIQIGNQLTVCFLPKVLKIPYIDDSIVGPCARASSLHQLGNLYAEEDQRLIQQVIQADKASGRYDGLSAGNFFTEILHCCSMGVGMISANGDTDYLMRGAK